MATKGDKARLYDVAFRLYVEGQSLSAIEEQLGVSRQTLGQWKADTKRPDQELDEWDRARKQKASNVKRLKNLFERELTALEESQPGSLSNVSLDALTKLGTLVQRWEALAKPDLYAMTPVVMDAFVAFVKRAEKSVDGQSIVFDLVDRFFEEVKPDGL